MEYQEIYDMQVCNYYICEKCNHVFDWNNTQKLPNGTAKDGSRICPCCGTEFVRKFRESDLKVILASIPNTLRGTSWA